MQSKKFKTVDEYFVEVEPKAKKMLKELRKTIREAAPQGEEVISYNMPAIRQNGVLAYYAAYKNHIGFYPTADPVKVFAKELAGYECSKGTVKFSLDESLPLDLIAKIVKFRIKQTSEKANAKKAGIK